MHFYPPQPINHIGTAHKAFWVLSWLTPYFPGVISRLKGIGLGGRAAMAVVSCMLGE